MKLSVYVLGREVAALEPVGDFKSVLTYSSETATDEFVSLTMPVRTESYVWDDPLHPIFQMNLPNRLKLQNCCEATTRKRHLPNSSASTPTAVSPASSPSFWTRRTRSS